MAGKQEWEILQTMENRNGKEKYIPQNASNGGDVTPQTYTSIPLYIRTSSE